jgi:diaminohydroxyphosphoribosylaminopyrimidine deaminase/5-amino-6-(5-phosphoribosylamino)uracil reductase
MQGIDPSGAPGGHGADATDAAFMALALAQAARGIYTTSPNPSIGCVIVRDGRVIGEGFTQPPGGPHAEIFAMRDAAARGESVQGATVYVTLEPCSHFGRTPPCADALVAAGVARVVSAMVDPNPQVDGTGNDRLRAAGITVTSGVLAAEAEALNRGFISRHRRGRPWVRVKLAMSLDGRTAMASGESKWITGPQARADVQHWRARSCAIVTGAGTVLADDPELNVRELAGLAPPYRQPLRVVLDRRGQVPLSARVFRDGRSLWVAGAPRHVALPAGVEWIDSHQRITTLPALFAELARRECNEVLVEAGAELAGSVIAAGLCDELVTYVAPKLLGDRARPLVGLDIEHMRDAIGLALVSVDRFGDDVRLVYRRPDGAASNP